MNKKHAAFKLTAAALIAGALTTGGMMAYFTDADQALNTFTVGKISVDLTEDNWDPEEGENIAPNQVIPKDPQLTNDGINDEFVFLEVAVPYAKIITANADGTRNESADTPLFSYETKGGWTLIDTKKDGNAKVIRKRYAYTGADASSMEVLSPEASTGTLFDSVTFVNALEGQGLEERELSIDIKAYAIQSDYLGENRDQTAPYSVWEILSNQSGELQ